MSQHLTRRGFATAVPVAVAAIGVPAFAASAHQDAELLALGSELEAVHAAHAAFDKAHPEAAEDPFYERHWRLREAISRVPASTLAGVAVKGRAAQIALHHDPANECECEGAFRDLSCSLIEDLLRLVSKGGANA